MLKYDPAQYPLTLADPLTIPGHPAPLTTLSVPLPGLLFLGVERRYFLWAFKTWKETATSLYEVPLANVHPSGSICFGNTTPPVASGKTIMKAWTLFWDSEFSNELTTNKSRTHREDILAQLAELHTHQAREYPLTDLVRARITIPQIIQQLTQTRKGQFP
jgi:PRTRC genetic system protein B